MKRRRSPYLRGVELWKLQGIRLYEGREFTLACTEAWKIARVGGDTRDVPSPGTRFNDEPIGQILPTLHFERPPTYYFGGKSETIFPQDRQLAVCDSTILSYPSDIE
jgi:hypothetical protein